MIGSGDFGFYFWGCSLVAKVMELGHMRAKKIRMGFI